MKSIFKIIIKTFVFVVLTILTQIGGIVFLVNEVLFRFFKKSRYVKFTAFLILYLISIFLINPTIAPFFGREAIKHSERIRPTNYLTVILNRNYVVPKMNQLLSKLDSRLNKSDIQINYLDANFPFIDKFPLLPHLSHNDGKKLDLSLIYETKDGKISKEQKSVSGYGYFVNPRKNEYHQIDKCIESGYFQYDYPKYLTFGTKNDELIFSERGTKTLINSILQDANIGKIFIEPHLKSRLQLTNNKIRYQGCRSVRHDDHIHIQLK